MILFHITEREAWNEALRSGEYLAPSLKSEGFIHLSEERQWRATAKRFYRGRTGLVLLSIDVEKLTAPVKYEAADGDSFPHLYGPLAVSAVIDVLAFDAP